MVAVFAIGSLGAFAGAAAADADPPNWAKKHRQWDDDRDNGGISLSESAVDVTEDELVNATFRAYGEILRIKDWHNNGRPAIAKLWVGGSGPAVFYADGSITEYNLSYTEGQTVHLQVCTSDSPNAVCTVKEKHPGRT